MTVKQEKPTASDESFYDFEEFAKNISQITQQSQELVQSYVQNNAHVSPSDFSIMNDATKTFVTALQTIASNPQQLADAQFRLYQNYLTLIANTTVRMMGETIDPAFSSQQRDKRFNDKDWDDNYIFDFIKQSYLLTNKWVNNTIHNIDDLDEKEAQKLDFYTNQFLDAISPTNFVTTNPEVIKETFASNGKNLVDGLKNLLEDFKDNEGNTFSISTTNNGDFKLGKDLAATKGKVVFQNELLQLIQYSPTTKNVHKIPLLIISPWINKYYILDMKENNSFVKWLVDKGYTVFVTSWVNPDSSLSHISFEDYLTKGSLAAIGAIEKTTGESQINIMGYCIGGTLTATTLAYLKKHKKAEKIKSSTFLTTLIDFSEAGDLGIFVSDKMLGEIEKNIEKKECYDGKSMSNIFSMLRSNDLIWSFVVNNYLMGKEPIPFDLLYWNSDYTNMPAQMHLYYLKNMYKENNLAKPNGLKLADTDINVTHIDTPSYFLSTKEDHIAPWQGTYKATQFFDGPLRFVLSGSGHIAGVVNPPVKNKYGYQTNENCKMPNDYPADAISWQENTEAHSGSWWEDWDKWMTKHHHSGKDVPARKPEDGKLKPIENAPGSYVKIRTK